MPDKVTRYSTIVGFAIRELREGLSVSQADLAQAVDMAQASWSKVEKGDTVANVQHLSRVEGKLGVPASCILLRADQVKSLLLGHGWRVLDRKLEKGEADLLLQGLMLNLNGLDMKAFDSLSTPAIIGGFGTSSYGMTSVILGVSVINPITSLAISAGAAASKYALSRLKEAVASSKSLTNLVGGNLEAGGEGKTTRSTLEKSLGVLVSDPTLFDNEIKDWSEKLKSENSNKSSAKSTNGRIFDMAVDGADKLIKMHS